VIMIFKFSTLAKVPCSHQAGIFSRFRIFESGALSRFHEESSCTAAATLIGMAFAGVSYAQTPPGTDRPAGDNGTSLAKPRK
jgi:hypothetical protein